MEMVVACCLKSGIGGSIFYRSETQQSRTQKYNTLR